MAATPEQKMYDKHCGDIRKMILLSEETGMEQFGLVKVALLLIS